MPASAISLTAPDRKKSSGIPPLQPGDQLSRAEFERRYRAMPRLKKAELIEGVVYMPSPVRLKNHARPHAALSGWMFAYTAESPGVALADNATVRLDLDNEPQPDLLLQIVPEAGGQARESEDDYIEGAPELVAEIVASSAAYDLHAKKRVYRRNGLREYLAWLVEDQQIEWWELKEGEYVNLPVDQGTIKSRVFPGLWLNVPALLAGDSAQLLATLRQGMDTEEHRRFVEALRARLKR